MTEPLGSAVAEPVWTARGPFDVGGRTRDIEVDVTNDQILVAASVTGGIWRSENAGTSWTKVLRPDQLHNVVSLAQDRRSGRTNTWYAGTGERFGSGHGVGNGVYKSTDGGLTWEPLPSTTGRSEFAYVAALAVDPSNTLQDEVYAATWEGIFRSTNGGGTWTWVLPGSSGCYFDLTAGGVVYAGYGNSFGTNPRARLLRSPDGVAWTEITPAAWPTLTNEVRVAIAPSNPSVVHFFTEADGAMHLWKYTYLSGNGSGAGGAWVNRSSELPWWIGTFNGYCQALAVRPNDEEDVFVAGQVLTHYSANAGYFVGIGNPSPHADNHAIAFAHTNPNITYVATDGGVYRADNGMFQFRPLTAGYVTTQFYSAALNHWIPGDEAVVGGTQDNWNYYAAPGQPAMTVPGSTFGSDGGFAAILPDGDHILVETHMGAVVRRNIRTGQESQVNPYDGGHILFINPYVVDPVTGYTMYYPTGGAIWRTADVRNPAWERLNGSYLWDVPISAIGVSTSAPAHRLYYGNSFSRVARVDDVLGASPVAVDVSPPQTVNEGSFISSISVDPENGSAVLVTASNYNVTSILYSNDAGATWSAVSGNLEGGASQPPGFSGPAVIASAVLPRAGGGRLYLVGTSVGLFSTELLQGANTVWVQEAAGSIGNVEVNQVMARASDGYVVVGTHGAGLFSAFYAQEPVDAGEGRPTLALQLEPPFPSPARTHATIPFTLETPGHARLEVFDVSGRRVATLADRMFGQGRHTIGWEARNVPAGVYILVLESGRARRTQKVTVAR